MSAVGMSVESSPKSATSHFREMKIVNLRSIARQGERRALIVLSSLVSSRVTSFDLPSCPDIFRICHDRIKRYLSDIRIGLGI